MMDDLDFRAALRELGVTQRWFAAHARVSFSVVNRWAKGRIPVPGYAETIIDDLRKEKVK